MLNRIYADCKAHNDKQPMINFTNKISTQPPPLTPQVMGGVRVGVWAGGSRDSRPLKLPFTVASSLQVDAMLPFPFETKTSQWNWVNSTCNCLQNSTC